MTTQALQKLLDAIPEVVWTIFIVGGLFVLVGNLLGLVGMAVVS